MYRAGSSAGFSPAAGRCRQRQSWEARRGVLWTEYWGGTQPWVYSRDVTGAPHGVILEGPREQITDSGGSDNESEAYSARKRHYDGTRNGWRCGSLGRIDAAFNQSCYGFLPDKLPPSVLTIFSVLHATTEAEGRSSHGSVFSTITMKTFAHLAVPEIHASRRSLRWNRCIAPLLAMVE